MGEEGLTGLVALGKHLDVRRHDKQGVTTSQPGVSRDAETNNHAHLCMRICTVHVVCLKAVGTVCSWPCKLPWRVRSMRGLTVRQHSFSLSPCTITNDHHQHAPAPMTIRNKHHHQYQYQNLRCTLHDVSIEVKSHKE